MAMRRGMGGPPQASDPTAVRRALTGPPAAWFSSGTMRIAALPLNRKLGRQLDILAVYFGWFSSPLGNTVGHLHWHLFPRYEWDPHPKRPIWETSHSPRLPGPEEYADTLAAIRRHLA